MSVALRTISTIGLRTVVSGGEVVAAVQDVGGHPERYRIITFEGAFHGRTLATLAAGGQKKYLEGFGPVVEGFDLLAFKTPGPV